LLLPGNLPAVSNNEGLEQGVELLLSVSIGMAFDVALGANGMCWSKEALQPA
jgi:hypothetical protein